MIDIVETLMNRHSSLDDERGWIVVSEKEWNAYYSKFGNKHMLYHHAMGGNTLSFRGCQLRVL